MLTCEGYKMFRGTGEIHHAKTGALIETQYGDWLYKPEYDTWYVNGSSCPAECVVIVHDATELELGVYDEVELYPNCTVQVLSNSITGETSIGWWRNGE